jgi:2-keto-3-deoxy-L-rhamnonate aldolase RhmA
MISSERIIQRNRVSENQKNFRTRLLSGERLIGTIVTFRAPEAAEILRLAGFDWLFLDSEHGPLDTGDLQALMQGAGPGTPCLVRVAEAAAVPIKQALDAGAAGIIAPMVNSAEQAARVVRFCKYPPLGERGVGVARAQGYGLRFGEYLERAGRDIAVVVQAEHIHAVENIESIVRVEGVDAVMVGPYDLSASLGRAGDVRHQQVSAAIERVTAACRGANVPLGIFGADAEAVKPYIERGYTLIIAGVDTMLLGRAAAELRTRLETG